MLIPRPGLRRLSGWWPICPITSARNLLIRWLTPPAWPPFWQSLTLMFQREVADRIVAPPGSRAYGRLSVLAQWRTEAAIVMDLPPGAFTPPPKIASAVVHLTALPEPRFAADGAVLERVTAAAFGQRRKMVRASLKPVLPDTVATLEALDIDPTARAETLGIDEFCRIARRIAETG